MANAVPSSDGSSRVAAPPSSGNSTVSTSPVTEVAQTALRQNTTPNLILSAVPASHQVVQLKEHRSVIQWGDHFYVLSQELPSSVTEEEWKRDYVVNYEKVLKEIANQGNRDIKPGVQKLVLIPQGQDIQAVVEVQDPATPGKPVMKFLLIHSPTANQLCELLNFTQPVGISKTDSSSEEDDSDSSPLDDAPDSMDREKEKIPSSYNSGDESDAFTDSD